MNCPKCKEEVSDVAKFCSNCGYEFRQVGSREKEALESSGKKALKVIGWIFVPYIMIFVSWKNLKGIGKTLGLIWAIICALSILGNLSHGDKTNQAATTQGTTVQTASTSTVDKPNVEEDAKVKAEDEAKAKADADAKAKAKADAAAKAEAAAKAKADEEEKAPHLDEVANVGNFAVAVSSKIKTSPTIGNQFLNKQAQGVYWLIPVAIKNNDKKSRMIDTNMFQLVSVDGTKYDPDSEASMYANENGKFFMQNINPGIQTAGYVVFDMPADTIDKMSQFKLKVDSGVGFAGGSSVYFILKSRSQ